MGITHFDDAPRGELHVGHLHAAWSTLGAAAGCERAGVRRIQVVDGAWSTPAHEHGAEEEIFYVLAGRGLAWQSGETAEVGAGDVILFAAGRGAHSMHGIEGLDLLAFGPDLKAETVAFPRLGMSFVGSRVVESAERAIEGVPFQFAREAELGPPELGDGPGPRPGTIVNVEQVEALEWGRGRCGNRRRNLGGAIGSKTTGIKHISVTPGKLSAPEHCHSHEEEIFVVLGGDGVAIVGEDEHPVRAGSVVARPAGTGVAHAFRAGDDGLTLLAYGTRDPGDVCYYPRSNKINFRGLGLIGRVERLDYWDGEEE